MSPDPGTASESGDNPGSRTSRQQASEAPTLNGAMDSLRTEPSQDWRNTHPTAVPFATILVDSKACEGLARMVVVDAMRKP